MFEQKIKPPEVARRLRVSWRSAYQWHQLWRDGGLGPCRRAVPPRAACGGYICFEDEAGFTRRPPKGRTWAGAATRQS
ncbi:helix-turn-helix domain-containing protein [Streptomyces sp. NPDC048434]|uniref:helix-turn-helix domain-containing protein n=1 Tax=Streptomyces sp. NPDC048434 TaxID=3365549 RepID=UPI0037100144